jgi:hypothetical protein
MDKNVKIALIFSLLLIAVSIFYYLVIFLPSKENAIQEQRVRNEEEKKKQAEKQSESLENCLIGARIAGSQFWDNECQIKGLESDCQLPAYNADRVDKHIEQDQDLCYKRFGN